MQRHIVLNSPLFLALGLTLACVSILFASVLQIWWLAVFALPGLMLAFRLERGFALDRLAELNSREDFSMLKLGNELIGVVGGYVLIGPATDRTLDAASALLQQAEFSDATDSFSSNPQPQPRIWRLSDICSLSFSRGGTKLRIVAESNDYVHTFFGSRELDAAMSLLDRAVSWESATHSRSVFRPDPMTTFLGLTLIFCAGVLAGVGSGLVNPGQLPLMTWKDLKRGNVRGRAGGAMLIAALFGEACLFLIQNLHPLALAMLGVTGIAGGGWILRGAMWSKVEETTWTHGNDR